MVHLDKKSKRSYTHSVICLPAGSSFFPITHHLKQLKRPIRNLIVLRIPCLSTRTFVPKCFPPMYLE